MGPGGKWRTGLEEGICLGDWVVSSSLVFYQFCPCMERGEVDQANDFLPGGPTIPFLNG